MKDELCQLNIFEAHQGLAKKQFSALELTEAFLERIKSIDKDISAFLSLTEEKAVDEAKKVDSLISKGEKIPLLSGIPFAVKDNILVEGTKTTCASKILENYEAPYTATSVKNLEKVGARVILGKTNLDEFAMGGSTENSAFAVTKNPFDLKRVAGGSSGGSAAAVAGKMAIFALGSDTGGSIRQPASFCGVVGLKPTYGTVSRYGLVAFSSSLDQIGPIANSVEEVRVIFEAIAGKDKLDSTSLSYPKERKSPAGNKKMRIGVPKEYFVDGMNEDVEKIIKKAIKKYEEKGAIIEEISLPHTEYALPTYYLVATSEASANLARFDGMRFGFSEKEADNLMDLYLKSRGNGFGREVKRRIMLGTYSLSAGYYDAYYLKAGKVRALIKDDFEKAFQKVDFILTPTTPTPAFKIGEKKNPLSMYLADIFTVSVNLAGLPAVSIPAGFSSDNLPVGLQIIGQPFEELEILEAGKIIEAERG